MFIGVQLTLVVICTLVLWLHDVYSSALMTLNRAFFQGGVDGDNRGFYHRQYSRAGRCFLRWCCYCARHFIGGCAGRRAVAEGYPYSAAVQNRGTGNSNVWSPEMRSTVLSWVNRALPERILEAVWGFFSAYALAGVLS